MRIVLLRALGLGDFLTGVPALRAVRTAFPRARIMLAAPAVLTPLAGLCRADGGREAVDEVVNTAPLQPLASCLHDADLAVNLHGRGPQSTMLLAATGPRRLLAFAHEDIEVTRGLPRWRAAEHEVARWCRLLTECGIPADPDPAMLKLDRPATASPWPGAVVVHAGASAAARRWPPDRWAEVATALTGRRIVMTGTAEEGPLASFIAGRAGLPPISVLAGQLDLTALAALTAHAALVLSGDTGMAHLAAAFGTPAVTLAGPVPPALWGPPSRPRHKVLWAGEPAGQSGDPHAAAPDPRLLAISPAEVIAAAETVLSGTEAG